MIVHTVVLEMSNTGNKVPNTGNAHYLLEYRYNGYTAIQTAVGAFPGKNSVIFGHFLTLESCFYTVSVIPA